MSRSSPPAIAPVRPQRLRSRTATVSFGKPSLNPIMTRDSQGGVALSLAPPTLDEYSEVTSSLDSSRLDVSRLETRNGRRPSKSVSSARPPPSASSGSNNRPFYAVADISQAGPSSPANSLSGTGSTRARAGLKRRISTPNLAKRSLADDELQPTVLSAEPEGDAAPFAPAPVPKVFETRARSTSTSIVVPANLALDQDSPTLPVQTLTGAPPPSHTHTHPIFTTTLPTPPPSWSGMYVIPPSPPPTVAPPPEPSTLLEQAYELGESAFSKVLSWTKPSQQTRRSRRDSRRSSDEDSEKGLDGNEDEEFDDEDDGAVRVGLGRSGGRYWGLFGPDQGTAATDGPNYDGANYFALPPTPPDERAYEMGAYPPSLPTPALSSRSLSHDPTAARRHRRASRAAALAQANAGDGWWIKIYRSVLSSGTGKTAEVLRELGWTVALLAGLFVVSFLLVVYALSSMPITQLKSMPKSTTDLQLLSHEMRVYMNSGNSGWWHTVGVLTYIGCWKHAWSVPGAVVLNILVGSVFEPIPALVLLTLITACGSLGAYSLSRPLAPLIGVLFPKPLALVRAALAPDSVPVAPGPRDHVNLDEHITPLQMSSDPTARPIGSAEDRPNVWRRLLLMRAMGFVPWSGMNVACGVVGVDWRTFWLTTAAGSASWSYVTASVGNILSRLALPSSAAAAEGQGESLTALLRDPTLIAKLVFLSLLTLVPVLLKRRSPSVTGEEEDDGPPTPTTPGTPNGLGLDTGLANGQYGPEPASPLAASLASFTPTPHVFDLLSFGRSAARQGLRVVTNSARSTVGTAQRLVANLSS